MKRKEMPNIFHTHLQDSFDTLSKIWITQTTASILGIGLHNSVTLSENIVLVSNNYEIAL